MMISGQETGGTVELRVVRPHGGGKILIGHDHWRATRHTCGAVRIHHAPILGGAATKDKNTVRLTKCQVPVCTEKVQSLRRMRRNLQDIQYGGSQALSEK
jgi:hypothetical protein